MGSASRCLGGAVLVQQDQQGRVMVLGEPALRDTAEGEQVDLAVGSAADLTVRLAPASDQTGGARSRGWRATLTNASARAAPIELRLPVWGNWDLSGTGVTKVDRVPTLKLVLPPNESAEFDLILTAR
jgi:hypothetical protein